MKCPSCGAENLPKNKFCGECGAKLTAPFQDRIDLVRKDIPESLVKKILLTKDTIEKERKDVTVVFADISGFTTMSEKLDPEELTNIMNECFRKLSAMVYRYEGIIDKFIGDCIMAIFGAPVTHEDDPERAILASLDMQNALNDINKNLKPGLKMLTIHSGINTGEVIAGKVGSDLQMDYTVMGDTVNVAQRLKDLSPPSTIYVGPETYNRARHAFDFMALEPVQLKGKVEMIKPYETIGRKVGSEYGSGAVHSDLIGRDPEMTALKKGAENLLDKKPSIYIIKGEIGVGKSRLLYEFKKYLTISADDISLIDSRGISYESTIPLKAFSDSIRSFLSAGNSKTLEISDSMVKQKLKELMADDKDTIPYLLKVLQVPLTEKQQEMIKHLDGHSLQLQIFLAIATLFEKISLDRPLIYIVDDIQWLDSATIELLNFLIPLVKTSRIAFYLSYRAGYVKPVEKLLQTIRNEHSDLLTDIELKNLNTEASAHLIANLAGQLPESIHKYIIEKSGGNPFFIEEIVRRILETGVLDKPAEIGKSNIQIPGSIDAAITSRIDNLGKEAKYLLKISSIIGRFFPQEMLELVVKDKDIYNHIDDLERGEFLIQINNKNEPYYAFRHTLFQEVAYNSLLKSERAIYHKVIAEIIEEHFKERFEGYNETLANHYLQCKENEKAIKYSKKAGDEAAEFFANEEALKFYEQALAIATDSIVKTDLLEKISDIEATIGNLQDALEHLDQAIQLKPERALYYVLSEKHACVLEQLGNIDESINIIEKLIKEAGKEENTGVIRLLYRLSNILIESKGETKRAVEFVDRGLVISQNLNEKELEAEGYRAKGHICWRMGKFNDAYDFLSQSEKIYKELNNKKVLPFVYLLFAAIMRATGKIKEAVGYAKKCIDSASKIGNQRVLAMGYNNIGAYYAFLGDYRASLDYTEKNIQIRRRMGDKKGEGIGVMNIGLTYRYLGEYDKIRDYYNRAEKLFLEINDLRSLVRLYILKCSIESNVNEHEAAKADLDRAYDIARNIEDHSLLTETINRYGDYYLELGDLDKAYEYFQQADKLCTETGDQQMHSEILMNIADLFLQKKDRKAWDYMKKGFKLAMDSNTKVTEIRAYRLLGRIQALLDNDHAEGQKNIKRAIAIAEEISAREQLAHSVFALGEILADQKKYKQALKNLDHSLRLFTEMNIPFYIEYVKKYIQTLPKDPAA